MNLWLLRHARAVPDPPPDSTDHDRPLAPRGRHDADALGRRLAADRLGLDHLPSVVLSSTAARTLETAERVLAGLGHPPAVERRPALYGASPEQVIGELGTLDASVAVAMVVGHNPTAHLLAISLDRAPAAGRAFPTCALAVFSLPGSSWSDVCAGTGILLGLFSPPY